MRKLLLIGIGLSSIASAAYAYDSGYDQPNLYVEFYDYNNLTIKNLRYVKYTFPDNYYGACAGEKPNKYYNLLPDGTKFNSDLWALKVKPHNISPKDNVCNFKVEIRDRPDDSGELIAEYKGSYQYKKFLPNSTPDNYTFSFCKDGYTCALYTSDSDNHLTLKAYRNDSRKSLAELEHANKEQLNKKLN